MKRTDTEIHQTDLLLTLDYLLHHTSEKRPATQLAICRYAATKGFRFDEENPAGNDVKRQRISDCLEFLEAFTHRTPKVLPFQVAKTPKGKYYVTNRSLNEADLARIVSDIYAAKGTTKKRADELVRKIVHAHASEDDAEKLLRRGQKSVLNDSRLSDSISEMLEDLQEAEENEERVWFKLKNHPKPSDFDAYYDDPKFHGHIQKCYEEKRFGGYVFRTMDIDGFPYVVIYFSDFGRAAAFELKDFELLEKRDMSEWNQKISYLLRPTRRNPETDIDKWLEKHFKGKDRLARVIKMKCYSGERGLAEVKASYEKYWREPFEYTLMDRVAKIRVSDEPGKVSEKEIVVQDACFEVKSNLEAFRRWYQNYEIMSKVVILQPAHLNDYMIGSLTRRFAARLTKYGARFNYELTRTPKENLGTLRETAAPKDGSSGGDNDGKADDNTPMASR